MPVTSAEMGVLKMVARLKEARVAVMSRKMVVSAGYIKGIVDSMVEDGLLMETPAGGYTITALGRKQLMPYTGFGLDRTAISNYPVPKAL